MLNSKYPTCPSTSTIHSPLHTPALKIHVISARPKTPGTLPKLSHKAVHTFAARSARAVHRLGELMCAFNTLYSHPRIDRPKTACQTHRLEREQPTHH